MDNNNTLTPTVWFDLKPIKHEESEQLAPHSFDNKQAEALKKKRERKKTNAYNCLLSDDFAALKLMRKKCQEVEQKISSLCGIDEVVKQWEQQLPEKDEELQYTLTRMFRHRAFLPVQRAAIKACLASRDVVVIKATGSGKSLIFQLSAVVASGLAIIIEPLKALIQDQIEFLRKLGIPVAAYHGDVPPEEKRRVLEAVLKPASAVKLLYVTPEILADEELREVFDELNRKQKISRFVVDEAHCINKEERLEAYTRLSILRKRWPRVPLIALTAAANKETVSIIVSMFMMQDHVEFKDLLYRPNLIYEVREKPHGIEATVADMEEFIEEYYPKPDQSGIIFVRSRNHCERVCKILSRSFSVDVYHRGRKKDELDDVYKKWKEGKIKIVVATIAFGMGIDKANVRFVLHFNTPDSIETYYQESGRAGRDGKPAHCIVYYRFADRYPNEKKNPKENTEKKTKELLLMLEYCIKQDTCRQKILLNYFDQFFPPNGCNNCDVCKGGRTIEYWPADTFAAATITVVQQLLKNNKNAPRRKIWGILNGEDTKYSHMEQFAYARDKFSYRQFDELLLLLQKHSFLSETRNSYSCFYEAQAPDVLRLKDFNFQLQVLGDEDKLRARSRRRLSQQIEFNGKYGIDKILNYNPDTEEYLVAWSPSLEPAKRIEVDTPCLVETYWKKNEGMPNSKKRLRSVKTEKSKKTESKKTETKKVIEERRKSPRKKIKQEKKKKPAPPPPKRKSTTTRKKKPQQQQRKRKNFSQFAHSDDIVVFDLTDDKEEEIL